MSRDTYDKTTDICHLVLILALDRELTQTTTFRSSHDKTKAVVEHHMRIHTVGKDQHGIDKQTNGDTDTPGKGRRGGERADKNNAHTHTHN